ncbi:DUF397 domain-containing protein [Amycolatopsis sp. NPDC049159]|uniref:DUF397 domain-containing protein n=1 Tax=Amycolatopsis sp. NPDC049159 TaxID=3157210 RepID=UPI003403BC13
MTVPEGDEGRWRTSSYSKEGQDCVEVDMDRPEVPTVGVRDSKDPEGGELRFARRSFAAFVEVVRQRG